MKTLLGFSVLGLILLLPASAQTQEKEEPAVTARLALVSSDKSDAVRNVVTLAEAKLSQLPHVKLLERQAIDKVLAEQKLSLSGVVATDKALAIGKLLSVDVFAVLEAGMDAKEAAGLVVFDAHTGVRLWDAALPPGNLDRTVAATVDAIQTSLRKRNDKLRSVCFMTVRNADLPRDLDIFCDSVGLLLERRLAASPDLAVLERRRLEQVNRERDLPADSPLRQLLASVVTIELEVGVSANRKGLKATALLSDGKGKSLGKATAEVEKRDAAALSQAVFLELARALKANATTAAGDRTVEAVRFWREAEFFLAHRDHVHSLRAAESAAALLPDDPVLRAVLTRGILGYSRELLQRGFVIDANTLALSLSLAERGSKLLIEVESFTPDARAAAFWLHLRPAAGWHLSDYMQRVSYLRKTVTEEERTVMEAIRTNHNKAIDLRLERARKAVRDEQSFEDYTRLTTSALRTGSHDNFLPPAEWAELLLRLRTWAEVARKFAESESPLVQALLSAAVESYGFPRRIAAGDADRLQKFWGEMEKHPHATAALYGKLGNAVNSMTFLQTADEEVRRQLREFRLFLQGMLDKDDKGSPGLRFTLYGVGISAFSSHGSRLKLPGQAEELKEFGEFMLRRKDIFPPLVRIIAETSFTRKEQDRREAYELIQRALDLHKKGEGRFVTYTNPVHARLDLENFPGASLALQTRLRERNPAAVPGAAAPWEKVTALIDVQPNTRGILWVQQPVVHEGSVYAAAIRMEGRPLAFSAQLIRLTPGKADPWEGKPIPTSLRLPVGTGLGIIGPQRHGIRFATSACIHEGRYYLGTMEQGIFVFPLGNGAPERITTADGLPSDVVQSLACLGGKLYASLGVAGKESYFAAWDLKGRKCDVLASSRRKEKRSPFDDGPPIAETVLLPDPARGRLLVVAFPHVDYAAISGLWALDAKSSEWKKLLTIQNPDSRLLGPNSRIEGGRLVFIGSLGSLVYDMTGKDTKLLFNGKVSLETGAGKFITLQLEAIPGARSRQEDASGPYVLVDGWVWGAWPFSRWRHDNAKVEHLAPLRPGPQFFKPENLQLFRGERELLVSDAFGIWLVTVRKN